MLVIFGYEHIPSTDTVVALLDQGLQCSVCMEDFKEDESVRRLHCEHCYHNDCIIPWLELVSMSLRL